MIPTRSSSPAEGAGASRHGPLYLDRRPRLVPVCGHAVFVAPDVDANCFFLDGGYWVLPADGYWRCGNAFDGPWWRVDPDLVPPALLRVPLDAYRVPPACLGTGQPHSAPRWERLWGPEWARRHADREHHAAAEGRLLREAALAIRTTTAAHLGL